jgi:hypothetical protein
LINQIDFLLDLLDCFFTFSIFYWTLDGELHALNFRVPSWLQLTLAHLHALAGHGDVSGCAIGATGASSGFDTGAAGAGCGSTATCTTCTTCTSTGTGESRSVGAGGSPIPQASFSGAMRAPQVPSGQL